MPLQNITNSLNSIKALVKNMKFCSWASHRCRKSHEYGRIFLTTAINSTALTWFLPVWGFVITSLTPMWSNKGIKPGEWEEIWVLSGIFLHCFPIKGPNPVVLIHEILSLMSERICLNKGGLIKWQTKSGNSISNSRSSEFCSFWFGVERKGSTTPAPRWIFLCDSTREVNVLETESTYNLKVVG